MTNVNSPFGGKPINTLIATNFTSKTHSYITSTSDATVLFTNDFVRLSGGSNTNGIPYVRQATSSNDIVGLVIGIKNVFTNEIHIYRSANTELEIEVLDDPYAELELQVNGTITAADIGKTANLIVGSGNTATGLSGMQLDITTLSTSGGQFKILGIVERNDNVLGEFTKVRCIILKHAYANTPSIVGDFHVAGKLTVDGLIDPTGLSLTPQASAPSTANGTSYYDSAAKAFKFRENGSWHSLGISATPFTATYYVDGGRTDSYTADGSQAFPFKTIQAAINAAGVTAITTGVTIKIARGTYVENLVIENDNFYSLTFVGDDTANGASTIQTVIQPASGIPLQCEAHNTNLNTLVFKNIVLIGIVSCVSSANTFLAAGGIFDNCVLIGNPIFNKGGNITIKNSQVIGAPNITSFLTATLSNVYMTNGLTTTMQLNTSPINMSFCVSPIGVTHNIGIMFSLGCVLGGTLSCHNRWDSIEDVFESGSTMTVATGGTLNRYSSIVKGNTVTSGSGVINQAIEPVSSVAAGLTAYTDGGQANATPAYGRIINVTTVSGLGDPPSIKLKSAKAGDWCIAYNGGAQNMAVFPQSAEYMNGVLNNSQVIANGYCYVFCAPSDGHWIAFPTVPA